MSETITNAPWAGACRRSLAAIHDELVAAFCDSDAMRQSRALAALSDAELSARGLTRQSLGRYVFADRAWA